MLRLKNSTDAPAEARELALRARLRQGDPGALNDLLQSHWPPLVAYVAGLGSGWDLAEDIVQEAFLRLWERRTEWSPTGSVRSLLYRICRNLALNERRSVDVRVRSQGHVLMVETCERRNPTPLESLEDEELRLQVERALAQLSPRRREVFVLRQLHGLSLQEAAAAMNISVQTVKNQMGAAIADLRAILASLLE